MIGVGALGDGAGGNVAGIGTAVGGEVVSWYGHHVRLSIAMACPALTVRPLHCTAHPLAVV